MTRPLADDLGHPLGLDRPPRRIVSLVPSLTEALAVTVPERLVGATDWCTHPADLDVARVRGTKNPDRAAIARRDQHGAGVRAIVRARPAHGRRSLLIDGGGHEPSHGRPKPRSLRSIRRPHLQDNAGATERTEHRAT